MYAAAFVTVMVSGLNQPAQLIIFGNLLDSFNTADTAEAVRLVHFFALMYAVVGIQQLITITLQTALATRVAAAQARKNTHALLLLSTSPLAPRPSPLVALAMDTR